MTDEEQSELESSELGTKAYWDKVYDNDLNNFANHGDVGEIWFGEESALRIITWLRSNFGDKLNSDPIIDVGCGNGMLLVELAREGYRNLIGVDYSEQAIELAKSVIREQNLNGVISLDVCDILANELANESYRVALDKGTYDAVSLNPENAKEKRSSYIENIKRILKDDGLLIITSCNWTDEEIIRDFCKHFSLFAIIPTPEFKFGGKVGKLISSVVLQKK